jgi:hypothetical protein
LLLPLLTRFGNTRWSSATASPLTSHLLRPAKRQPTRGIAALVSITGTFLSNAPLATLAVLLVFFSLPLFFYDLSELCLAKHVVVILLLDNLRLQ